MERGFTNSTSIEIFYKENYSLRVVEEEERWHGAFLSHTFWGNIYRIFDELSKVSENYQIIFDIIHNKSKITQEIFSKYLAFHVTYRDYSCEKQDNELFEEYVINTKLYKSLIILENLFGVPFIADNGFKRDLIYSLGKLCFNRVNKCLIDNAQSFSNPNKFNDAIKNNNPFSTFCLLVQELNKIDISILSTNYDNMPAENFKDIKTRSLYLLTNLKNELFKNSNIEFFEENENFNKIISTFIYPQIKTDINILEFAKIVSYYDPTHYAYIHPLYSKEIQLNVKLIETIDFDKLIVLPQYTTQLFYYVFPVKLNGNNFTVTLPFMFTSENLNDLEKYSKNLLIVQYNSRLKEQVEQVYNQTVFMEFYNFKALRFLDEIHYIEVPSIFNKHPNEKLYFLFRKLHNTYVFCCCPGYAINEIIPRYGINLIRIQKDNYSKEIANAFLVSQLLYNTKMISSSMLNNFIMTSYL